MPSTQLGPGGGSAAIRDLFKEEYSKRAPADQLALAKKFVKHGIDTKDDIASKYVLLREAREIAVKCAHLATALGSPAAIPDFLTPRH